MATYSVYYMKAEFFRDGIMGFEWLRERNLLPDPAALTESHVFLLRTKAASLDDLYYKMQGEKWSIVTAMECSARANHEGGERGRTMITTPIAVTAVTAALAVCMICWIPT